MPIDPVEVDRRIKVALTAIGEVFGTEEDEYGATLFVSHHLKELEGSYWEQHLKDASPDASRVLDLLVPSPHWSAEEDGMDMIDFTLPGEVTNYVICVCFDDEGIVEDVTMES